MGDCLDGGFALIGGRMRHIVALWCALCHRRRFPLGASVVSFIGLPVSWIYWTCPLHFFLSFSNHCFVLGWGFSGPTFRFSCGAGAFLPFF